jgi:hypothetical protein
MYGGERPPSSIGGSTFIRHNNLGNAEVKVTLLPKDGNTPVVSNTISSDSINNIAPFLKGNEIHYENMKWEVSSGELPTLTIPGDKFNEQPEKKSKIILIYKESTDDKLNYKLMHDEKTMNPKNPEVLDYVKTLVEGSVPSV